MVNVKPIGVFLQYLFEDGKRCCCCSRRWPLRRRRPPSAMTTCLKASTWTASTSVRRRLRFLQLVSGLRCNASVSSSSSSSSFSTLCVPLLWGGGGGGGGRGYSLSVTFIWMIYILASQTTLPMAHNNCYIYILEPETCKLWKRSIVVQFRLLRHLGIASGTRLVAESQRDIYVAVMLTRYTASGSPKSVIDGPQNVCLLT